MNTPEEQAMLYRKAADTIEMCGKHGVKPQIKVERQLCTLYDLNLLSNKNIYEFPLAVIEGKLVWKGDKLFYPNGESWIADNIYKIFEYSSWNPPKPKTVMVELLVEDAKILVDMYKNSQISNIYDRTSLACRKALDKIQDC